MTRSARSQLAACSLCGVLLGCAGGTAFDVKPSDEPLLDRDSLPAAGPEQSSAHAPHRGFALQTESPQLDLGRHPEPVVQTLEAACGVSDSALVQVATHLAAGSAAANGLDVDALGYDLRAAGSPYVWPRAWRFDGKDNQLDDARARMQRWLAGFGDGGLRRCGIAIRRESGARIAIFAVAVDVLADLAPLPTRARVGQWMNVSATLRVPADGAKLIVLGPQGAPYTVPTTLDGANLRARFNADHEGAWLIQVLGSVSGGPRPLLEAMVFAGVEPPVAFVPAQAPGEEAARTVSDPQAALFGMVNAARATERAPALQHDTRLDALAQAHAEAMRSAQKTAHDAGDGDLNQRLANAGLELRAGENVAHAASAQLSHRVLWASPSHRENLLFPDFDAVGIGVAPDADGTLWVCELFATTR